MIQWLQKLGKIPLRRQAMTDIFGTWQSGKDVVTVEWHSVMGLTVRKNGRLAGFKLTVEMAQGMVNRLVGSDVWTD
jgi:hypothetical protein